MLASPTESDSDTATRPTAAGVHGRCAATAIIVAGGFGLAAAQSAVALLVVTAAAQAVLIVTWVLGGGMPGRIGGILIAAGAAAGADVGVSVWPERGLAPLVVVLGLAVPVMFVHQLARGVVRTRTVESLAKVAVLVVAVTALAGYAQLRHEFDGKALATGAVLAAAVALTAGHLSDLVWPKPRFDVAIDRGLVPFVVGIGFGAAAGIRALHDVVAYSITRAGYVGAAIAAVAGLLAVGAAFATHALPEAVEPDPDDPPARSGRPSLLPFVQVLLPFALVAPVAYLVCVAGNR